MTDRYSLFDSCLYTSQFRKIDTYDWFCGPGSHIIISSSTVLNILLRFEVYYKCTLSIIKHTSFAPRIINFEFNHALYILTNFLVILTLQCFSMTEFLRLNFTSQYRLQTGCHTFQLSMYEKNNVQRIFHCINKMTHVSM